MTSLTQKLTNLASSPQVTRLAEKAREVATKPANRERVAKLVSRFSSKTRTR